MNCEAHFAENVEKRAKTTSFQLSRSDISLFDRVNVPQGLYL
jgi:hypothetical protein